MSVSLQHVDRRSEPPARSSEKRASAKSLRIGAAGDAFEREADRVADSVTNGGRMPEWSFAKAGAQRIQRQPTGDPIALGASTDQQQAPQPNNYKDATGKLGEAFLQTDVGKKLKDAVTSDPLVKGAEDFVGTLPGKIIVGAAATAAVSTLAATHKALPVQIPEIPLDTVHPGLKVKVTYEGAVDHPTKAMITFSFTPGGGKKKHEPSASERRLAETAPIAASMDEIRAGMHYAPGTPQAMQDEADQKNFTDAMSRRIGVLPGTGGVPLLPPAQTGQADTGGTGWTFSPLAHPQLDKKLDLQPLTSSTVAGGTLQRKCSCEGIGEECAECKKKSETVQRKAAGPAEASVAPPIVDQVLNSSGRPLDKATRNFFEPRFGYDFSKVRIHADAQAAESARAVNALAYTVGDRIAFGATQYSPQSGEGRRLLAHELTHVVQQSASKSAGVHAGAGMFVRGTPGVVQRKVEMRDLPRGEQSGFARVPELIRRLNGVSTGLTFRLEGRDLKYVLKQGGNLSNFDTQMKGFIDQAAVIPMRISNRHGRLRDPQRGYVVQILGDEVSSGYVDIDDLLASDDLGLVEDLLHFMRERTELPNYANRLGSPSLDPSRRENKTEFEVAHEKGIDSEESLMQDFFGDRTIQTDPGLTGPDIMRAFINSRNDHIVTRIRFGSGVQAGVQSFHVEVITADKRTLTPEQYKALSRPHASTGANQVQPKAAPGAGIGKPPSGLWLSTPGDVYEHEADRAADAVMDGKPAAPEFKVKQTVQRRDAGAKLGGEAPDVVREVLSSSGRPLDKATRDYFEPRFGYDFSKVRIHADAQAAESARAVNALAYTVGGRIAFDSGQYSPEGGEGRRLLAHELAHVVQQGAAETVGSRGLLSRDSEAEREAGAAGNAAMSASVPPIRSRVPAGLIGRAEKDPPQPTLPGGSGTGNAGAGSTNATPSAGSGGTGPAAKPQPLRFDILGADLPLVNFLAQEAKRARDPDLRVSSLEDMIKKLEDQTPAGSGKCVEHINIYNHGAPGYQRVAGGEDKKGGASPLPDSGFNLDWLYQPANQAALARLRRVFCCGASMDWLGCGVAGVTARGGKRSADEVEKAGKIGPAEKASRDERYYQFSDRYQNEEEAQKHGASLQGATFGKITVGTWSDATCTSVRAATDFVFHDPAKGYRVGYRGEFLNFRPSSAGQCSCDPASGRVQGQWDPGKGIDPGSSKWQADLAQFNQAVKPLAGSSNPQQVTHWMLELMTDIAPELEIPAGLPVGAPPRPWIDSSSTNPNFVARTYDHLALCNPNDIWKWIGVNRTLIQQTPAYTKTVLNHELMHASDINVSAFEYKLANGAPPPAPADACKPGYNPTASDPFGKYVLDFRKWRSAGMSESRHLEIYAGSAATNFQRFSPEEKASWFSSMITEVPPDVRATDPLPTEALVAGVFLNPVPYEAAMRVKFEAQLFKVVNFYIYGDNAERGVDLGKARTLINHFGPVWAINPGDRKMLSDAIVLQAEKKPQPKH